MTATRPLRVAIVGAGPAGVYTADCLLRVAEAIGNGRRGVSIDIFDKLPTPYGLIRYGVAPDHPRIKAISVGMTSILGREEVRFFGNVSYPQDITLPDLHRMYDAVVFATGASKDRDLDLAGIDLNGSFGGADFVSWYDAHPDVARTWPLQAHSVAVIGAGNVALDVARVVAKSVEEMMSTDIPANVEAGLRNKATKVVHLFARRGPAQVKFTPLELRELGEAASIRVHVDPADLQYDAASRLAMAASKQLAQAVAIIEGYAASAHEPSPDICDVHLHFFEAPVELVGEDGQVTGIVTERQVLDGASGVLGTGERRTWPVQAVYRAVGYKSDPIAALQFEEQSAVVSHAEGRVRTEDGESFVAGVYVSGWVKRGPVGLIGHTRSDAKETVTCLMADLAASRLPEPIEPDEKATLEFLEGHGVAATSWEGWQRIDAHEAVRGAAQGRARVKLVDRDQLIEIGRT